MPLGINCKCDPTPGEDPPAPTATTLTLSGDEPVILTSHPPYVASDLPADTTEIINTSGDPGLPASLIETFSTSSSANKSSSLTTTVSSKPGSTLSSAFFPLSDSSSTSSQAPGSMHSSRYPPVSGSSPTSSQASGSSSLVYITGPLPEPTSLIPTAPAATSA